MEEERTKDIPEKKKKMLANLIDLINKSNTIMIVSIENIPAPQFQKIKRSLKDTATIKVIKKSFMFRAFEDTKKMKKDIEKLENWLQKGFAIIFSNIDPFELSSILADNKFPAKAKAGQTVPKDIIVDAGPTDLPAGPIISELSKVNIKARIERGKIVIKESCIIVKEGEKLSKEAASILTKLEITPFTLGFEPLVAYDSKESRIYEKIKVDKEAMVNDLKQLSMNAFNLAFNISYLTKETFLLFISKANQEANIILNLIK